MTIIHNLGFPRIGAQRELKRALEAYWRGETGRDALLATGVDLRRHHWRMQRDAGLDLVPVGDFSWYDQVLDTTTLLGAVPERFGHPGGPVDLDTYFRMARGRAPTGEDIPACEMTKWFDTNYHYLVPELSAGLRFSIASESLFRQVEEALAEGVTPKPVLIGPISWLWLGKARDDGFDRLSLLESLLEVYAAVLTRLSGLGVEWVQLDEPALATDLDRSWRDAALQAYRRLADSPVRRMVATYFGGLGDNLPLATALPVDGLHVDLVRAPHELTAILEALPADRVLSAGVIDGRNIWRADLDTLLTRLEPVARRLGERLWLAPSCSLMHVPVDTAGERTLDPQLRSWLAFGKQKLDELAILRQGLDAGPGAIEHELATMRNALRARDAASSTRNDSVRSRLDSLTPESTRRRSPYPQRAVQQRRQLALPALPTTTIGSFPQTGEIRRTRRDYRAGRVTRDTYVRRMQGHIARALHEQETVDLDVLVHGEPERNDMVEYFGEQLAGFASTEHGWVQSYGSRCVKPPIIHGDVYRPRPMTTDWIRYAQDLTERPVKGMLTGPVTILQWSFVRDDQPRQDTCRQIALALRDEVADLEAAGTAIIQIDEPAFREALPLRRMDQAAYLEWAVQCFRLASCGVKDSTQIHTHMCYSEFNDIIEAVAAMDADVITIETARSAMELLQAFERFRYPNEIGPGVYDIHSPRLPSVEEVMALLRAAVAVIPEQRLWVNPDCGLKTRSWDEVRPALINMVEAAKRLRAETRAADRRPMVPG